MRQPLVDKSFARAFYSGLSYMFKLEPLWIENDKLESI